MCEVSDQPIHLTPQGPPRTGKTTWTHNQALMELGALVCTARVPRCGICPVTAGCATFPLLEAAEREAAEREALNATAPLTPKGKRRSIRAKAPTSKPTTKSTASGSRG